MSRGPRWKTDSLFMKDGKVLVMEPIPDDENVLLSILGPGGHRGAAVANSQEKADYIVNTINAFLDAQENGLIP